MVAERRLDIGIYPEAFPAPVVVLVHLLAAPVVMTFYTEMVLALDRKLRLSVTGLQQALREGDAGRYAGTLHLLDGNLGILVYIFPPGIGVGRRCNRQRYGENHQEQLFHRR